MRAIVLGSGLSNFSDYFEVLRSELFENVLDVEFVKLDGHERKFVWCRFGSETFLIISGKLHFYEGHNFDTLIAPIRYAVEELGVEDILVTSASGGLGKDIKNGHWTYIEGLLSIPVVNLQLEIMTGRKLGGASIRNMNNCFSHLPKVVYSYHQGPSLGTNAEYRMLDFLGVDIVGMSMYPEYCYLKTLDIKSHFLSIPVCNYFPFEDIEEPSFEEVLSISSASIPKLVDIFKEYLLK